MLSNNTVYVCLKTHDVYLERIGHYFFKDVQQEYQLFLIDSKKIRYINPDLFRNTKMKYKQ